MKNILQSRLKEKGALILIFKKNSSRKWFALSYIVVFFLLELMIVTNSQITSNFDYSIQNLLADITNSTNNKIFEFITLLAKPVMDVFYLIIIMVFLWFVKRKKSALWLGFVLISGNIIAFLVKITVRRTRPTGKIIPATGYSFPSGHVFGTTLVVLAIILFILPYLKNQSFNWLYKTILILWLILVAISRVYLHGHFPTDVIGSILLAGAWWESSELLYLRYCENRSKIDIPVE